MKIKKDLHRILVRRDEGLFIKYLNCQKVIDAVFQRRRKRIRDV